MSFFLYIFAPTITNTLTIKRNTYRRNLLIINKIDIYQVLFYRKNHQHHTSSYSFSFSASVVRTRLGSWAASGSQFCQQRFNFVAFVAGILACWSHKIRPRHHVFRSRRPQFHRNPRRHHSPVLSRKYPENSRFSPKSGLIWWDLRGFEGGLKGVENTKITAIAVSFVELEGVEPSDPYFADLSNLTVF